MRYEQKEKVFVAAGWTVSAAAIVAGGSFLWPHVHTALLGIALLYLGVRVFNFVTFAENKESRRKSVSYTHLTLPTIILV